MSSFPIHKLKGTLQPKILCKPHIDHRTIPFSGDAGRYNRLDPKVVGEAKERHKKRVTCNKCLELMEDFSTCVCAETDIQNCPMHANSWERE